MEWDRGFPTIDGFYWVYKDDEIDLVELFWHAGLRRLVAFKAGQNGWRELGEFSHFWGPLQRPEPPSAS